MKCSWQESKTKYILCELGEHLPYSVFGVIFSLVLVGIFTAFTIIMKADNLDLYASEKLFHIFHGVHVLLSAIATTSMFWTHQKNVPKAIVVGFFGSLLICGVSDILLPFFGGRFLESGMQLHLCVLEHSTLIISLAFIGIFFGLLLPKALEKSSQYSHAFHVLVSSMASILYLISYGLKDWVYMVAAIFLITIIAVMIPCCLSDVVFPLLFVKKKEE